MFDPSLPRNEEAGSATQGPSLQTQPPPPSFDDGPSAAGPSNLQPQRPASPVIELDEELMAEDAEARRQLEHEQLLEAAEVQHQLEDVEMSEEPPEEETYVGKGKGRARPTPITPTRRRKSRRS